MTTFESPIKTINKTQEDIFTFLSDFNNFTPLIPADKVEGWRVEGEECYFKIPNVGDVSLKIIEKEAPNTIKIAPAGKVPFEFNFWVQLKSVAPYDTKMKLTIKADLNMMMKMVAKKPIQNGIEAIADGLAAFLNAQR